MADITTEFPKFGDTTNTLWLKIAGMLYGMTAGTNGTELLLERPAYGDTTNTLLLKVATYLQ